MKNFDKDMIKNLKQNSIYMFAEVCLFLLNLYKIVIEKYFSIFLIISLFVIIILHISFVLLKKSRKKDIPYNLRFMVEFCDTIGYTKDNKIENFSDRNCSLDKINKVYEIDGVNVKMQKEYIGRILSNTADGIKIMTCGGSSVASSDIKASTYTFDYDENRYRVTNSSLILEDERSKLLKIDFGKILAKEDPFKVKYIENQWDGAMRKNYDGIVIGEHLFYNSLKEQDITLKFMKISNLVCEIFQYNFKTSEIQKLNINIKVDTNECHCSIKSRDISKYCIYFLMYRYD